MVMAIFVSSCEHFIINFYLRGELYNLEFVGDVVLVVVDLDKLHIFRDLLNDCFALGE